MSPKKHEALEPEAKTCEVICETTATLHCPRDRPAECVEACAEMRDSEGCTGEIRAFLRCAAAQEAAHWECGDDGESTLRGDECDTEQRNIVMCLEGLAG